MQIGNSRPRLGFWARNAPLWLIGAFALLFGTLLVNFYSSDVYAQTGIRCYQNGSYGQAEGWLRRSTRINPDNGRAAYYLGLCLLRDGRSREALRQFHVALSVGQGVPKFGDRDEDLVQEAQAQIDRLK